MSMEEKPKCFICNTMLQNCRERENQIIEAVCPVCGGYAFSTWDYMDGKSVLSISRDFTAAFLYHKNKMLEKERPDGYTIFIGEETHFNEVNQNNPNYHYVSMEEIKAFWPHKFSDRIDYILLAISRLSRFFGEELLLTDDELKSLLFLSRYDENGNELNSVCLDMQYDALNKYLTNNQYVKMNSAYEGSFVELLSNGWRRVDDIQQNSNSNKNVFVAMSFADNAKRTREAIRKGVIEAGFSPEFMDEIIHNQQIVPEMFRLIRECRLLILDISEPNYGAYYEAGYARGLGKDVIISCSSETYYREYNDVEEKKYERYLKPHFDIAQNQILVWTDEEDLIKQMSEWIKAIIR